MFYDEVQYTKNDWRNRNRIQTEQGLKWLTIPCGYDISRKIYEVKIKNEFQWQKKHFDSIVAAYKKAPFFHKYRVFLEDVYFDRQWEYLYQLDRYMIQTISKEFLGINTAFRDSREFASQGTRDEKLLSLLRSIGCNVYVSGPAARSYMDVPRYEKAGIHVEWKDYSGYPEYPRIVESQPFEHGVSILDMLFHVGDAAPEYIWGWREKRGKGGGGCE